MINHRRRDRVIATCLAALAGYVDALGFLELGGFFVSFMSGNSTRLGVGLGEGSTQALIPAGLVCLFIVGVVCGSLVGHFSQQYRRPAVLFFVSGLLAAAALSDLAGLGVVAVVAMVIAMGAENSVFERGGEVSIGVTYMTGTLVKLGQRIAAAMLGGDKLAWSWYLLLWLGLVAGAVTGATVYAAIGLGGLWIAAVVAALLATVALFVTREDVAI